MKQIMSSPLIEERILVMRGQRVMLDRDLAELFGVETKQLNRQVKRNIARFPKEFMFQLTRKEKAELVPIWHRFKSLKHTATLPFVFTEHGVAMLATVLNSQQAIKMSIFIIKIFVQLRETVSTHKELEKQIRLLETRLDKHDDSIQSIVEVIRQLMTPRKKPRTRIGFRKDKL